MSCRSNSLREVLHDGEVWSIVLQRGFPWSKMEGYHGWRIWVNVEQWDIWCCLSSSEEKRQKFLPTWWVGRRGLHETTYGVRWWSFCCHHICPTNFFIREMILQNECPGAETLCEVSRNIVQYQDYNICPNSHSKMLRRIHTRTQQELRSKVTNKREKLIPKAEMSKTSINKWHEFHVLVQSTNVN